MRSDAEVAAQRLGNEHGAVGLLIRLQQRDVEPRQRGAGAVERVAELVFPVLVLEAQRHAARLEVAEIRAARHFEIGVLAGRPDFDVVGLRRAEADVAGAEFDDAVVQAEQLQHFLRVGGERFEFGERMSPAW